MENLILLSENKILSSALTTSTTTTTA